MSKFKIEDRVKSIEKDITGVIKAFKTGGEANVLIKKDNGIGHPATSYEKYIIEGSTSDIDNDGWWERSSNLILLPKKDSIVQSVRKDLKQRSKVGIDKYACTLDRKDLSLLEWHQHHYEELLDAALYTKRIIQELKTKNK